MNGRGFFFGFFRPRINGCQILLPISSDDSTPRYLVLPAASSIGTIPSASTCRSVFKHVRTDWRLTMAIAEVWTLRPLFCTSFSTDLRVSMCHPGEQQARGYLHNEFASARPPATAWPRRFFNATLVMNCSNAENERKR